MVATACVLAFNWLACDHFISICLFQFFPLGLHLKDGLSSTRMAMGVAQPGARNAKAIAIATVNVLATSAASSANPTQGPPCQGRSLQRRWSLVVQVLQVQLMDILGSPAMMQRQGSWTGHGTIATIPVSTKRAALLLTCRCPPLRVSQADIDDLYVRCQCSNRSLQRSNRLPWCQWGLCALWELRLLQLRQRPPRTSMPILRRCYVQLPRNGQQHRKLLVR